MDQRLAGPQPITQLLDVQDRGRRLVLQKTLDQEVQLRDRTTEKVLRTYSFSEREPFSPRAGRVATLRQAREEALRDLAEHIVYWLETRAAG